MATTGRSSNQTASLIASMALTGLALALPPHAAVAQTDSESTEGGNILEEVTVYARKRAENLQEVPIAISAFSADDIEAAGMRDTMDLASMTPGFNMAPLFGGDAATPVIRGLSTTIGEPNVGFFVDGVYIGSRLTMTNLLGGFIERIEVAKGPQSALYGRNTFGGAVNFVTKQPSQDFEGDVEFTAGSDGRLGGRATLGGPFGDGEFAWRLGALYDEFDGFYTNELTGDDLDHRETKGMLAGLGWDGEDVDVNFNLIYQKEDKGDEPLKFIENNDVFFPAFGALPPDFQIYTGTVPNITSGYAVTPGGSSTEQMIASLSIEWDFGPATFSSITGYNDLDFSRDADDDYDARVIHFQNSDTTDEEISQEFRITSNSGGPFEWMAGLYYYSLDQNIDLLSAYQSFYFSIPPLSSLRTATDQSTDDYAIFGSLGWDITDTFSLTLSGRFGKEKKRVEAVDTDPRTGASATFSDQDDWTAFLPRLTVDWQFADNHMLYASYAYSEKSGGFNVVTATGTILPEERSYEPEKSDNYEIGVKSTFAGGRVQTTLASYYINWTDQIVRAIGESGALLNTNVGETTSTGVEFEAAAAVAEKLDLRGGFAYNQSEYDDYFFAVLAALGMDPVLDGNTLQYAPEWTANLSATFTQPVSNGWDWFTRFDWDYLDRQTIVQTNNAWTDSSSRFNLRTGLGNGHWRVTLWAYNLFDDDTTVTGVFTGDPSKLAELVTGQRSGFPIFNANIMGPQLRSYGVTVNYRF